MSENISGEEFITHICNYELISDKLYNTINANWCIRHIVNKHISWVHIFQM